jgi:putative lipoic acid-binding regulatory protein
MPETCESNQSFAVQLIYPEQTGMFARIAQTIGQHGGDLGRIDMLGPSARLTTRGISIRVRDAEHLEQIVAAVRTLDKVKVVDISKPELRATPQRDGPAKAPREVGRRLLRRGARRTSKRRSPLSRV